MNVALPSALESFLEGNVFVFFAFVAAVFILTRFFRERRRTIKVRIVV